MATWRAENSMLTQIGVEILNKVKAGVGKLTVSRVVAGSGRVSESELYTQTIVSGSQKEMSLNSVITNDGGSEFSVHITNNEFMESFDIHQIGIYVTHPDYIGEQLYHISQCDSDDFDTIPAVTDTPVTQGYSLYLEHGNSESVEIVVNRQGVVSITEFNEFKTHIETLIGDAKFVPLGYVEEHLKDIMSEQELDEKIEAVYSAMEDYSSKKVLITLSNRHPVIGGGDRILRIDKMTELFGVIHTISYDSNSAALEYFRSKVYGNWTSWARTYSTHFKPTHIDVGASPYSGIYDNKSTQSNQEIDSTILGWFDSMPNGAIHSFVLNSGGGTGATLEGGTWFITISRANDNYGTVSAHKHLSNLDTPGMMIKTCSIYNKQLMNWGGLFSDALTPATVEN